MMSRQRILPILGLLALALTTCLADLHSLNEETLAEHNKWRELHGEHALVLDEKLIELAQKDAEKYALTGVSGSVVYKGVTLGKNIAIFKGYRSVTGKIFSFVIFSLRFFNIIILVMFSKIGKIITDLWYNTGKSFNYNVNDFQNAGSFTQVLWKNSNELGVGEYQVGSNIYVVGLYYPPGNIVGRVHENVHPLAHLAKQRPAWPWTRYYH